MTLTLVICFLENVNIGNHFFICSQVLFILTQCSLGQHLQPYLKTKTAQRCSCLFLPFTVDFALNVRPPSHFISVYYLTNRLLQTSNLKEWSVCLRKRSLLFSVCILFLFGLVGPSSILSTLFPLYILWSTYIWQAYWSAWVKYPFDFLFTGSYVKVKGVSNVKIISAQYLMNHLLKRFVQGQVTGVKNEKHTTQYLTNSILQNLYLQ